MNLHILHTVSGIITVLLLISKVIIHYRLDHSQNSNTSPGQLLLMPLHYLGPYKSNVENKYLPLKRLCNFLLILAGIALCLNIVIGVLIYFT